MEIRRENDARETNRTKDGEHVAEHKLRNLQHTPNHELQEPYNEPTVNSFALEV